MANQDSAPKPRVTRIPGVQSGVWKRTRAAALSAGDNELFERAFRHAGIGMALLGLDGRWLKVNELLCRTVGYSSVDLLGRDSQAIAHPDDVGTDTELGLQLLSGEIESYELEKRYLHKDGRVIWIHLTGALVRNAEGQPQCVIAQLLDITQRMQQEEDSRRTKQLLEATLANIQDGVALLDAQRNVLVANGAYGDLFALDPEQLVGLSRDEFVNHVAKLAEDPSSVRLALTDRPPGDSITSDEFLLRSPQRRYLRRTMKPVGIASQQLQLVVWRDVTAEKDLIAERERELFTDGLTGIASRRAAETALVRELARLSRNGVGFSIAMFDIDRFKEVNDQHGHPVGDEVLRRVAGVLAAAARATDLVARWGGEEFIAIIASDLDGARAFCERARAAVAELSCPGVGRVTMSAGATDCGLDETAEELIARADRLLYAAKGLGRNRVVSEPTSHLAASMPPRRSLSPTR